ncbi:DUF1735 domain-containing protein [Paraflavitalea pollutisoli]|uniref:DUF1735 domain-containing protein n=1 Tax=Paraflavitalea pollutisoli TaxID=3034143 RepID=UPI0023EABA50|nr:DUF1735 domain-containing protein [Paraflavitalea sp. H1-2-19X]
MKLNRSLWLTGFAFSAMLYSSCLKKAGTYVDDLLYTSKSNLVELRQAEGQQLPDPTDPVAIGYAPTPAEESLLIAYVRLASASLPTAPVTVKVKLNNSWLPAGYVPLPANAYSFVTPPGNMTIPAQSRFAAIRIVLKKQLLDPAVHYGLGLELEDAGAGNGISERSSFIMVSPQPE